MYLESESNSDVGGMRSYLKCDVQYPLGSSCRDGAETSAFAAFWSGVAATECTSYTGFGQLIRGLERWQRNLRWCLPSWEVTWTITKALFASMIFLFPVWWDMLVLWRVIILKTLEMFVFTRKLLHLEDANVRLDSENKKSWAGMINMVTCSLCKVAYIFTYQLGILSTYLRISHVSFLLNSSVGCPRYNTGP